MKLDCGIRVYLEASKVSNERRYSFEGKPAHSGSLYNLNFIYTMAIANDDSRTRGQNYRATAYKVIAIKPTPR